jgi:hypothetical protein
MELRFLVVTRGIDKNRRRAAFLHCNAKQLLAKWLIQRRQYPKVSGKAESLPLILSTQAIAGFWCATFPMDAHCFSETGRFTKKRISASQCHPSGPLLAGTGTMPHFPS